MKQCRVCSKKLRSHNQTGLCTKHYYEDWRSKNEKHHNKLNYEKHKDSRAASMKRYADENKEKLSAYHKEWRENNKAAKKEKDALYYVKTSADFKARAALRKKRVRNATPKWLTKEQIQEIANFYKNCPQGYHVDHVIPLKGKIVSGLHVIQNLQYLLAEINLAKGNKY